MKLLAKTAEDRYQSALEVQAELVEISTRWLAKMEDASLGVPSPMPRSARPKGVTVMFACVAVLLVAAAGQIKPRRTECKNACINNLRQIDGAKEQYALQHKIAPGTIVTAAQVGEYLKGGVVPPCPGEGNYSIGAIGEPPTCNFLENAHKLTP